MKVFLLSGLLLTVLFACNSSTKTMKLHEGIWRGSILIQNQELPFTFEVKTENEKQVLYVINAQERLPLDEITYSGDTVRISMGIFDADLVAVLQGNELKGEYIKNSAKDYRLPFSAKLGANFRFVEKPKAATVDFSGKYDAFFLKENGDSTKTIGVFEQKDNNVTGTFLTTTGDYRFLEGVVENDEMKLSTFDGTHLYLFKAKKLADGTLQGEFWSGKSSYRKWVAQPNAAATLPKADSLTVIKAGYDKLEFSFPNLAGKKVSLTDERFKNKVVVLQIMGSWCPNCMDETAFLSPFYTKNKDKGIEFIGLAYETNPTFEAAVKRVEKLKKRFDVQYELLIAGTNDKVNEAAAASLPALNHVMGFPTTIFIDKKGKIRKIHTGFSGSGTGKYYDEFVEEFTDFVTKLSQEPI